jgi:glutamate-1-semialdehyde 2,1-aminomutase
LARAYTGRRVFIRFEGHYHGWLDNVLGGLVHDDPVADPNPYEDEGDPLGTNGRDPAAFEQCFRLPWNDAEVLEKVLERYGEEVALIHMEPVNVNGGCLLPRPGYLEKVRELSRRFGVLLSFDEVITGFRIALGGAQEVYGVTPDLATYGKALAAGVPISAVAGKAKIMDQLLEGKVVGAGTFNGYPLGITAALTTVKILEKDEGEIYRRVDEVQKQLMDGLHEIGTRRGMPHLIQGCRGVFLFHFTDLEKAWSVRDLAKADHQLQHKFRVNLAEEGVLIMWGGRWYISAAVTEADVDRTLDAADRALGRL